jgi:hypothetical protein
LAAERDDAAGDDIAALRALHWILVGVAIGIGVMIAPAII